jgi:uncharacterized protein
LIKQVEIKILPKDLTDEAFVTTALINAAGAKRADVVATRVLKRSIDARSRQPLYILRGEVAIGETFTDQPPVHASYQNVASAASVIIVGAGPAGYFAALECLILGLKPIVLERGKDIRARRRDLRAIQQFGIVHPHSNYCFGEGGAGTYSDGKLYTRSSKRGDIEKVLHQLVEHNATTDILVDAHPHIGSNKLPDIVANIRKTIFEYGGEVHFDTFVTDFILEDNVMTGVIDEGGRKFSGSAVILATGHSARDIYILLDQKGVKIEAKPFALGVRIEHAQSYIDELQYKQSPREENLPAASYKAVCQVNGAGVFSFCMCPGGLIVPSATAPGEIVVNGMSLSRRDSPFSNSGFVTSIELEELDKLGYKGTFASMQFQQEVEQSLFQAGDGSQKAPAQRVSDFVQGKLSTDLYETSYIPGLFSAEMHKLLPSHIADRLRKGITEINKKMRGYLTDNANIVGTESRTSSPIRIPRDPSTFMHPEVSGLFPCGEGPGYAGGILSAAMDGQNAAKGVMAYLLSNKVL